MSELNPQQHAAVHHIGSPLLVLAGAGSGKTRVITRKIAWLIQTREVSPSAIAAVTFTNKAAREMKARVDELTSGTNQSRGLTVSTFHSLGLKMLKLEHQAAGLRSGFSVIDPKDAVSMIGELMRSDLTADSDILEGIHRLISSWKNAGVSPQSLRVEGTSPLLNTAIRVYPEYERYLRACNAVDLDDLILLPLQILNENADVSVRWREKLRYILVDEYQDTNGAQYELIKQLAGEGRGLTVVGDDDQSIYGWRGAMPENLMQLATDFLDLEVVKLEQNYRSVGRVLKLANSLISNNQRPFQKTLWSDLGYGDPVRVIASANEDQEADRVVSAILKQQFQGKSSYSDFAILYRSNHQARVFEQKLRAMRIPYQISGGLSFFDRAEIRDMMAYLRLLTNQSDDRAFFRITNTPRRGVGPNTLEKLAQVAAEHDLSLFDAVFQSGVDQLLRPQTYKTLRAFCERIVELGSDAERGNPVAIFQRLLDEIDYENWLKDKEDLEVAESRWQNITDLLRWIGDIDKNSSEELHLTDIVSQLLLRDILDRQGDEAERDEMSLMTLHAAKGLEFNHVYIVGVEEELIPHRNSIVEDALEEERRLFYVGITRAMKTLHLSYCQRRRRYGENIECEPSRFLRELPADELDWDDQRETTEEDRVVMGEAGIAGLRAMLDARKSDA